MKKSAFTLIELLVVIAIIALLLAIMMPALGIVKQKAQGVVCLARLKNLSIGYQTYAVENGGKLPNANTPRPNDPYYNTAWVVAPQTEDEVDKSGGSTVEEKINGIERGVLWDFIKDADAYHCVGDQRYKKPSEHGSYGGMGGFRSYSIPGGLNGGDANWVYKRLSQIKKPSSIYAFVEEAEPRGYNLNWWALPRTGDKWTDPIAIWHNEKSALGFVDGHAEMHNWKDKTTLEMGWNQTIHKYVDPEKDGEIEDLRYMQEHYPYKG
ncbi:type II secretion system protein G [Anaerohalosphaera lusitana]|uniref:Type II secretion system protein G n=1 Tax=Anaerohalosphaera lusitana TaxID=1936003 RepID=A0A1U9NIH3_9BACT|nr:prepilin-type N-terminal cleavage/methylation domain-containing protein [Anaerohalosphaera lusitana]AQT67587.1 type II secretion system protein G [Anaerohalosphaera lusitana]